ncbi:hypothetical protein CP556_20510 [Natrinema sp. CBA1119]|nr:hypothetical protein CP556_20510 [Natrinema sp. CBA1119]
MTPNISCTRAEFYARRDDRTEQLVDTADYQTAPILITVADDVAATLAGQVMTLTACNITSRFNRNIDVIVSDVALETAVQHADYPTTLAARAWAEMAAADPFGTVRVRDAPADDDAYEAVLAIGNAPTPTEPTIRIAACGWSARIQRNAAIEEFTDSSSNPIGPAAAACFGVGELFKALIGRPAHQQPDAFSFDAFSLTPNPDGSLHTVEPRLPSAVDLGMVELAGVGSIGSALLYVLAMLPVQAELALIDHDVVEFENLNRSPIFTAADADVGDRTKVAVGEQYLAAHDGISVQTFPERYGATQAQDSPYPDIVLPEVDDDRAREDIQYSRPPLMIETTTNGTAVNVRRQIPIQEACLLCHFPPDETSYSPACAMADVDAPGVTDEDENGADSGDAALPFVSCLAGVLLAGELVKTQYDDYPSVESFIEVEMFTNFDVPMPRYEKGREDNCPFCSYRDDGRYRDLIKGTRFFSLTQ